MMTASHCRPLTTEHTPSPKVRRILSATVGGILAAGLLGAPVAAVATESTVRVPAVDQQPDVAQQVQPDPATTFGEPAPPIDDPTATSGTDPVTGFAINARTGFLVHPPTGYLIEPDTGLLLFAETLIYTNLQYDEESGEAVEIEGETPVPPPSVAAPTPSGEATAEPTGTPTEVPPTTEAAAPEVPPAPETTQAEAPVTASAPPTPQPSRSSTPTAESSTAAAVEEERTSSLAPVAWIGGGILAVALAVVAVLAVRRRGRHQP